MRQRCEPDPFDPCISGVCLCVPLSMQGSLQPDGFLCASPTDYSRLSLPQPSPDAAGTSPFPMTAPLPRLRAVSGDGQQGTVGKRLARPTGREARPMSSSPAPCRGPRSSFSSRAMSPMQRSTQRTAATDSAGRASAEFVSVPAPVPTKSRLESRRPASLSATFVVTAVERDQGHGRTRAVVVGTVVGTVMTTTD